MYRWKGLLEAIQLPGDLSGSLNTEELGEPMKKGNWLVFANGAYIGSFGPDQFQERIEAVPVPRKRKAPPVAEEKPKQGRPRGMKSLLVIDGQTDPPRSQSKESQ